MHECFACMYICVPHASLVICGGQKRGSDILELELGIAVILQRVTRVDFQSSARTSAPKHSAISPTHDL